MVGRAERVDRLEDAVSHEERAENARTNVAQTSDTFHPLQHPSLLLTMIEWMNAVPTSQGIRLRPRPGPRPSSRPSPSSVFDQSAPSMIPVPRKVLMRGAMPPRAADPVGAVSTGD